MTTKQIIQDKLENLTEEQLNRVYEIIEKLSNSENISPKLSLMERLQQIEIDAPKDFSIRVAANLGRGLDE
ncbi:hypothetical protein [Spirulina sp. 06S082]|uniref:hypothetical protein n=1 Tax=Spirulina sp. 06S082 TaxID=3110248 RepID=UPI002B1EFA96|nr:hypothetical protein [Spirulina sp. 06S082]MEA5467511.1 hypothetical protein [Spirulina sp. 06S082]